MISFFHSEEYLFSLLRVSLLAFYLSRAELSNIVRGFSRRGCFTGGKGEEKGRLPEGDAEHLG